MLEIEFALDGEPIGKGRPRFSRRNGIAVAYTPAKTRNYERSVYIAGKRAMNGLPPIASGIPCSLEIDAYWYPPKSISKKKKIELLLRGWRPVKCDIDNIVKACLDGLNGVCYVDDNQVTRIVATKMYSDKFEGIVVKVKELA